MIVGTAGHIDHGKTSLVKALTGIDADRLKEEKARGITIDLGFAYKPTADGGVLGFVDVPGHERLVRNMLAGATGIDHVLLVVAADDGPMPQTREHLAILDLLGLTRGAVVLTKSDLVPDARLAEVRAEIDTLLQPTGLAGSPVFAVSNVTGAGMAALEQHLRLAQQAQAPTANDGLFRLAVDRCFSLSGIGTVVTGTAVSTATSLPAPMRILPITGWSNTTPPPHSTLRRQLLAPSTRKSKPARTASSLPMRQMPASGTGMLLCSRPMSRRDASRLA